MKFLILTLVAASFLSASAAPLVVAHRGASHDAPENTLPAFNLAWSQGADAIEGDFHLSSDGKILCIHDRNTQRVAGKKLVVKNTPMAELQGLDVGGWKGEKWKGTTASSLSDVLACVPKGKRIFIEVKSGPAIVPAMIKDIKASGLADEQVTIIAFDPKVIEQLKKLNPVYQAYWLTSFKNKGNLTPGTDTILKTLKRIKADGVSTAADRRITSDFINTVKQAGYSYHVWTINKLTDAKHFEKLGVDSITTNRPAYIRSALQD